jgi:hypothetical protein
MWSSGLVALHLDTVNFLPAMNNVTEALPLQQVPYIKSQGFSDANSYGERELRAAIG